MATRCFTPLLGKRIRVTKEDACGALPATAAPDSYLATDGFVTLSLSSEIEDGAEIITRKADGSLCVNEKRADSFKRFTVEMEFCGVNPSLLALTTNAKAYSGYGATNVIGFTVPEGEINKWFALELWTGMAGGVCAPGAATAGGYLLMPFLAAGTMGDIEVAGEDVVNFSMTGAYTKGGNQWGIGPWNVVLGGATTNEIQTVTITGAPTGGTFTLSYGGQTTAPIAYNAASAAVQTALQALTTIGTGNATVGGGPGPATPYTVTFTGTLAGTNVNAMSATGTLLTGGTTPAVAVTTPTQGSPGVASPLPTALDPFDHLLMIETSLAPPPSACSPLPMP